MTKSENILFRIYLAFREEVEGVTMPEFDDIPEDKKKYLLDVINYASEEFDKAQAKGAPEDDGPGPGAPPPPPTKP